MHASNTRTRNRPTSRQMIPLGLIINQILLIHYTSALTDAENVEFCPHGWINHIDVCYLFDSTTHLDWYGAEAQCKIHNSQLLSMADNAEQSFIEMVIRRAWIGMNAPSNQTWIDNNKVNYSNWLPGQPDGRGCGKTCLNARCVTARDDGLWSDQLCNDNFRWLCKKEGPICESGWHNFSGHCYYYSTNELKTWVDANDWCVEHSSLLTSILDQPEQTFVEDLFFLMGKYWIGYSDVKADGEFSWIDRQIDFIPKEKKWVCLNCTLLDRHTTDGKTDCVIARVNPVGIEARSCYERHNFICKMEANSVSKEKQNLRPKYRYIFLKTAVLCITLIFGIYLGYFVYKRMSGTWRQKCKCTSVEENLSPIVGQHETIFDPDFKGYEIKSSTLQIERVIGSGAFSIVFYGTMGINGNRRRQPVAIKAVKESATDAQRESFVNEIRVMISVGRFRNIVKLIGCCTLEYPYYAIFEYMEYGDLHGFLRKCHQPQCQYPLYSLDDIKKCNIARQVALGMEFLSLRRYYHGDLAARNILVGKELTVKISDFGLSTDIYTSGNSILEAKQPRPILWASVETNLYGICTSKSDVWSFGVLLYEIYTFGAVPYPGVLLTEVVEKIQNGYRMPKPVDCPQTIYAIMLNCWDATPLSRRTFTELVEVLNIFLEEFSQNDYMPLEIQEKLT